MIPIEFPEANLRLVGPPGVSDILPLPVFTDGRHVASVWELSDEEIADLVKTRRLYLVVVGQTHPPLLMQTRPPFAPRPPT